MNLDPHETKLFFYLSIGLLVGAGFILLRFFNAVEKTQTWSNLRVRQLNMEHENKLATEKLAMRELTFQQISRELHDNVKLSLVLAKLNLHTFKNAADHEKENKISSSIDLIHNSIEHLNDISLSLNTDWIRKLGLFGILNKEIGKLENTGLFTVETDFPGESVKMDAEKELFIFRIVQETFNNIIKHAEAKRVMLSLAYNADHAQLTITDDGKGFDHDKTLKNAKGSGISNIKARATAINAKLTINAAPGKGTSLNLVIPYDAYQPANQQPS